MPTENRNYEPVVPQTAEETRLEIEAFNSRTKIEHGLYQQSLTTFTWTDPDDNVEYKPSFTDNDMLTTTKLKAWFDLGGSARDWKFDNGVVINVDQDQFLAVVAAGIAAVESTL